jgi:hypothetical protein
VEILALILVHLEEAGQSKLAVNIPLRQEAQVVEAADS